MQITQVIPINHGIKDNIYFATNMRRAFDGGLVAGYSSSNVGHKVISTATARLETMSRFTERAYTTATNNGINVWGLSPYYDGGLWVIPQYGNSIEQAIDLGLTPGDDWNNTDCDVGYSSALETTNDNEIIYSGRKYVGKSITSTLNGSIAVGDTSIAITDATDFPATGQAVITNSSGAECIEYTGITTNTLTGVTRNKYYTTAQVWSDNTEIVGFRNHWLTWTAALGATTKSPSVKWEDYILIGRGHTVGGWKDDDGADFDEAMLTLPSNYEIVDITTVLTGAGTMILIAANRENSGGIFVWNGVDTDWSRIIECGESIKKLDKSFVALGSGLYQTDTYSLSLVAELPDDKNDITSANFNITDIKVYKNEVICAIKSTGANRPRIRGGLWIYGLATRDWLYCAPPSRDEKLSTGAIFVSSEWKILYSTNYKLGSIERLNSSQDTGPSFAQTIYDPNNGKTLKLQEVKLNLHPISSKYWLETSSSSDLDVDIIVRVYDYQRPFFQYVQTSGAGTDTTHFAISKTLGMPHVGDRMEITDNGGNAAIAGLPRNITAITTGASTYTLTLDTALPETLTDYAKTIFMNPLKKLKTITLNSYKINPDDLRIVPVGQPKFKKLMIEVEIRDRGNESTTSPAIQLNSIELKMEVL